MAVWKDDIDYPSYFKISDDGQVFSKRTNKILKTRINKNGYVIFTTRFNGRGKSKTLKIHRMVAKAFLINSNFIDKKIVNHIDGNKLNNNVSNLEWVTYSENTKHAYSVGLITIATGYNNALAKLTANDIDYIRQNCIKGSRIFGCRALAKKFNVHHSVIEDVVNKKRYK